MMKHPFIRTSLFAFIVILLTQMLTGCFLFADKDVTMPVGLDVDGRTVSWNEVENATSYTYMINDSEATTEQRSVVIGDDVYGDVLFKVRAQNDDHISDFASITFTLYKTLDVPLGLSYLDGAFTWSDVDLASGYELSINDVLVTLTETRYDFVLEGVVSVTVKATGNPALGLLDSNPSTPFVIGTDLDAPTGLKIEGDHLSFDDVSEAARYHIFVNGILETSIQVTEWQIPASFMSDPETVMTVQAVASDGSISPLSAEIRVSIQSISNEEQLRALSPYGVVVLENDIALGAPWIPMPFYGIFDGQGHTISGIEIATIGEQTGFFSLLENATITDLTLIITIDGTTGASESSVGGLAGWALDVNISEVSLQVDVEITSQNGTGVLGGVFGTLASGEIDHVSWAGRLHATHMTTGGFAGVISPSDMPLTITFVQVSGAITANGGEQSAAGGFVGIMNKNNAMIDQIIVDITLTGPTYVGGFVGIMGSGTIRDVLVQGSVHATSLFLVHAGGFVGRLEGYNSNIQTSIAMVEVTADLLSDQSFLGAFVGHTPGGTYHQIYQNCYADLNTTSLDRIGNPLTGRGDGITSFDALDHEALEGFDPLIWTFGQGPSLKAFE